MKPNTTPSPEGREQCESFWGTNHQFGKWKVVEEGDMTFMKTGHRVGFWVKQERICKRCNYKEIDFTENL